MSPKPASFILLVTKGILRDRVVRRQVLSWIVAAVLGVVAVGMFLLDEWLAAHPLLFLLYWGGCLWLTATSGLLALYDLLALRAEAAREHRRIAAEIFGKEEEARRKKEPPADQP